MKIAANIVCPGLKFPEGPCIGPNGTVYFVELPRGCVSKSVDGRRVEVADMGGSPNGAAFGPDGKLYICNGGGNWPPTAATDMQPGLGGLPSILQCVRRDGTIDTLVETIDGIKLNAPNDLCLDCEGGIYFTDPAWAERDEAGVAPAENSPPGSLCYYAPDGRATRIHTGLLFPNGIQVSGDGKRLFVAETGTGHIKCFPILSSGAIGAGELFCDLGLASGVDGMCLDAAGQLHVAGCGSSRIYVIGPDGTLREELELDDRSPTNLCFGGDDMCTLFVTAGEHGQLVSLRRETPGAGSLYS